MQATQKDFLRESFQGKINDNRNKNFVVGLRTNNNRPETKDTIENDYPKRRLISTYSCIYVIQNLFFFSSFCRRNECVLNISKKIFPGRGLLFTIRLRLVEHMSEFYQYSMVEKAL